MSGKERLAATVFGFVQGVGFRFFVLHEARRLGLGGYVRNLPGGSAVEVVAEGTHEDLEELRRILEEGPPGASVERVAANWQPYTGEFPHFEVRF